MQHQSVSHLKIVIALSLIAVLLTVGTFSYHAMEGWSYVDSAYFTTITLMTIGYGDIHPTHDASKVFTIFFAICGAGMLIFALSIIAEHYILGRFHLIERGVERLTSQAQRAMSFRNPPEELNNYSVRRQHIGDLGIKHKFAPKPDTGLKPGIKYEKKK